MKVKEESEKVGLKLNIQKTKIMASSPTTSWQIDRETVETVPDFIFGGSKITADVALNHMDIIFQFVNVVYYGERFAENKEPLQPWDKTHLVMVYDLFNMLLDSVC